MRERAPDATVTIGDEPGLGPCLVVLDGSHARRVPLPFAGRLIIGRSEEADLPIEDVGASRRHAELSIVEGRFTVEDLESHNGTYLNGERVAGTRPLYPGDTIQIGTSSMVLVGGLSQSTAHAELDETELRSRLQEEVARALEMRRPSSLLVYRFDRAPDQASVRGAVMGRMRTVDFAAWTSARELTVLVPELDGEQAEPHARRSLDSIAELSAPRVGLATVPFDAVDAEGWIAAARAAASLATPGTVMVPSEEGYALEIAGHRVLVADPAMVRMYELLRRIAASELAVVISGETGAGKENAARAVHHWSRRAAGPFLTLNCAALPEALVESELFGHERGAFTGAAAQRVGLLESASGGTVLLDEIGELAPAAQAKILRAVETKRIARVGGAKEIEIDVRIVAATHRNLQKEVKAGRFREDLYFRLAAATIVLLPLRERRRELPLLARAFAAEACARSDRPAMSISAEAMSWIARYPWPGNVRELRHAIEFAVAAADEGADRIDVWNLSQRIAEEPLQAAASVGLAALPRFRPVADELRELERARMIAALEAAGGVQKVAAEMIGMPLRTFGHKYRLYKLSSAHGR